MANKRSLQILTDLFNSKTVVDLPTIQKALNDASVVTTFRHLKQVPYRRSYNHNCKYYTLHDPSRYDRFGLWSWKGIHFSVDGSLKNTIRRLVEEAVAGTFHWELQERLRARAHNTLLHLYRKAEIAREAVDGNYLYLHSDKKIGAVQLEKRQELLEAERFEEEEVTDTVVIQVLLLLIRYPGSQAGDVARRLKGHSPPITMRHVRMVFDRFDLDDVGVKGGPSRR
jgi:hypothetical protein